MRIILLAAGMGVRLYPLTRTTPKLLVDLGEGHTLLERQLQMLGRSTVIDDVVYVVGYLAEQIEEAVRGLVGRYGLSPRTTYNPFYDCSNNLASLWLARHEMDGDVIISNGDNLFHPRVYRELAQIAEPGVYLTISHKALLDEDDMKVALDEHGLVCAVGKDLSPNAAQAESVGLVLVRGERCRQAFLAGMESLMHQTRFRNAFWLEIFNVLCTRAMPVHVFEINGQAEWQEVDFHLDIEDARALICMWGNRLDA